MWLFDQPFTFNNMASTCIVQVLEQFLNNPGSWKRCQSATVYNGLCFGSHSLGMLIWFGDGCSLLSFDLSQDWVIYTQGAVWNFWNMRSWLQYWYQFPYFCSHNQELFHPCCVHVPSHYAERNMVISCIAEGWGILIIAVYTVFFFVYLFWLYPLWKEMFFWVIANEIDILSLLYLVVNEQDIYLFQPYACSLAALSKQKQN